MKKILFAVVICILFSQGIFAKNNDITMEMLLTWIIIGFFVIVFLILFAKSVSLIKNFFANIKNKKLLETVTKSYRGTSSERKLVLRLLKHGIPAQSIFHDLYVEKASGAFSQIDLVVATKVGLIVFEVKDYSGWIFGKGYQNQWTQVLAYGKEKYRFYNPIIQNNGHIMTLKKQLKQFEKVPFYSTIVFYGNCELKDVSYIPQKTFLTSSERVIDVINTIMNENEPANYSDKFEIINVLKEAVKNGENIEIQNKHIETVRNMLGKDRIFQ